MHKNQVDVKLTSGSFSTQHGYSHLTGGFNNGRSIIRIPGGFIGVTYHLRSYVQISTLNTYVGSGMRAYSKFIVIATALNGSKSEMPTQRHGRTVVKLLRCLE